MSLAAGNKEEEKQVVQPEPHSAPSCCSQTADDNGEKTKKLFVVVSGKVLCLRTR